MAYKNWMTIIPTIDIVSTVAPAVATIVRNHQDGERGLTEPSIRACSRFHLASANAMTPSTTARDADNSNCHAISSPYVYLF